MGAEYPECGIARIDGTDLVVGFGTKEAQATVGSCETGERDTWGLEAHDK